MESSIVVLLAVFAFMAIGSSYATTHERFEKLSAECAEEDGIDDDVLVEALKAGELPDDKKIKDHISCLAKKLELLNDEEKFDSEKLGGIIDSLKTEVTDINDNVDECRTTVDGDPVAVAFKAFSCIYHSIEDE